MQINLATGTLDSNEDLDGWVITSPHAMAEGRDDLPLLKGDHINLRGEVLRDGEYIGTIGS